MQGSDFFFSLEKKFDRRQLTADRRFFSSACMWSAGRKQIVKSAAKKEVIFLYICLSISYSYFQGDQLLRRCHQKRRKRLKEFAMRDRLHKLDCEIRLSRLSYGVVFGVIVVVLVMEAVRTLQLQT